MSIQGRKGSSVEVMGAEGWQVLASYYCCLSRDGATANSGFLVTPNQAQQLQKSLIYYLKLHQ